MFKRLPHHEPPIEWVNLWRCPQCSTFNRRATPNCSHCDYHLGSGVWAKWIPLTISEGFKRFRKRLLFLYISVGWILLYGLSGFLFWKLRLYTFRQNPVQEMLAALAMILLLITLVFFRQVFRPRWKSPIGAIMDLIAGLAASSLCLFTLLIWSQVFPPKPTAPLAIIPGSPVTQSSRVDVQYAVVSWPLIDLRKVTVMRVNDRALVSPWRLWLYDVLAVPFQNPKAYRPRLTLFSQPLLLPPGNQVILYEPQPGGGIAVRKAENAS